MTLTVITGVQEIDTHIFDAQYSNRTQLSALKVHSLVAESTIVSSAVTVLYITLYIVKSLLTD